MTRAICGLVVGAALAAACTGVGGVRADATRTLEIEMKDFGFAPRTLVLEAGQNVTLVLRNTDTVEHELMAGRDPSEETGYKQDLLALFDVSATHVSDDAMAHARDAVAVRVAPGQTATISFLVPGAFGRWEIGCFLPGHYAAGMRGSLSIGVPGAPRDSEPPAASGAAGPAATAAPKPLPTPAATGEPDMDAEAH